MDFRDIVNVVKKASEAIHTSEKFPIAGLALRATKAAERFPYDNSIVMASQLLNKMSESQVFISRQELNNLYDTVYSHNTKLGQVFASELSREKLLKGPTIYDRTGEQTNPLHDFEKVADPVMSNALKAVFDKTAPVAIYSKATATNAENVCNAGLMELGLTPKKIDILAGQEDLIICRASYETPKGDTNVLIPIEIQNEKAFLPNMFLSEAGFVELTAQALKEHIISKAGKSVYADGKGLLKLLSSVKHKPTAAASDVELAMLRMATAKAEKAGSQTNGIIGLQVDPVVSNIPEPIVEKTAEHMEFEKRVTSQDGAARFLFTDRIVNAGRDMLVRKMAEFGYKGVQVKVAGVKEKEIHYAIGVGVNAAIMAPVKVANNMIQPPSFAIASGKIKDFSKSGIDELVYSTTPDKRMLAVASLSAGLTPEDLIKQVKEAVAEGNLLKAEDAINVLGETDKHAQKIAIAIFMKGLSGSEDIEKVAEEKPRQIPLTISYQAFYPQDIK